MNNKNFLSLGIGFGCLLLVLSASIAIAGYKPPEDQKAPKYSSTQLGTRGQCGNDSQSSLKILAPQDYVGKTASSRPTFAWIFNSSESFALEFRLYEYGANDQLNLIYQFQTETQPDITTISLPEHIPDLVVDQRYVWQVAVLCNPNYPSQDLVTLAEFEVVAISPDLAQEISKTDDHLTKSELYAQEGLWYDALSAGIQSGDTQYIDSLLATLGDD